MGKTPGGGPRARPRRLTYGREAVVGGARSYGPGPYAPAYGEGGRDYPAAYVRWTAGRNLEAFLALPLDTLRQDRVAPPAAPTGG